MLSHQIPNLSPGRHQRQNSTPTVSDTQKTHHRRGLSLDQPGHNRRNHGLPSLDENSTGIEYILGQQLTQAATMREAQQQPMARPGFNQETMQRLIEEKALRAEQTAPRPERDTQAFSNNRHTTPTTEFAYETQPLPRLARDTGYFSNNYHDAPTMDPSDHTRLPPRQERGTESFPSNYQVAGMTDLEIDVQQNTYESFSFMQQPCTPPSQTRMSRKKSKQLPYHHG